MDVVNGTGRQAILTELWEKVLERHLRPEDNFEIAALLESFGWTDRRVKEELGVSDVFQLASEIRSLHPVHVDVAVNNYKKREPKWPIVKHYIREFLRGMIFALPMGISVFAMLTLRFSLWSYLDLPTRSATAIAIGTILSFITAGGFMQAMARQGFFYMFQDHYLMMRKMIFRMITTGAVATFVISFVGICLDVVFPELPYDMLFIALLYYIILDALWLSVAVLYILRKELWFTALLTAGIGCVYIGFVLLHLNILLAQVIAMSLIVMASLIMVRYFMYRMETTKDVGINPRLPKVSVTIFNTAPFFVYGALYFTLLFMDRIIAWSDYSAGIPFVIWFRGDYELGLDFALVALTIPMGASEVIVSRMISKVWSSQKDFLADQYKHMNNLFTSEYTRHVSYMAILSLINAICVFTIVHLLFAKHFLFLEGRVTDDWVTNYVFLVALISYSLLAIGLLHSVMLFSLSRAELVLRPIVVAVALNFLVGFLLSRWFGYPEAVWGLFVGCVCFVVLTSKQIYAVFQTLDFHMYYLS